MPNIHKNQVIFEEILEEAEKKPQKPPLPTLTMGKDKKTAKVVITVTDLEKQWIRYLAHEAGFKSVTDYMLSFIYAELEKILEEEILQKNE